MYAVRFEDEIKIFDGYLFRESIKDIPGRRYDADDKTWCVPLTEKNVSLLVMFGVEIDEELRAQLDATKNESEEEEPMLPMHIFATPYKHQVKAFNFALRLFGMGECNGS